MRIHNSPTSIKLRTRVHIFVVEDKNHVGSPGSNVPVPVTLVTSDSSNPPMTKHVVKREGLVPVSYLVPHVPYEVVPAVDHNLNFATRRRYTISLVTVAFVLKNLIMLLSQVRCFASRRLQAEVSSSIFRISRAAFASVGDQLPSVELHLGFPPKKYNVAEFCKDKSVILVGLPGAFTPT